MVFCQAVWYTQTSEHAKRIVMKGRVIMGYGWATVFTLAAWFAGLVLDANVTFFGRPRAESCASHYRNGVLHYEAYERL